MTRGTRAGLRLALLAGTMLAAPLSQGLAAEATRYSYDALGRVVAAVDSSGKKVVYAYDNAGNRTRLSNGVEFAELIPTAFSASSNAGTTGLSVAGAMRDGQFGPLASIHVTNVEAAAWIMADLGSVKSVNHMELAPALALPLGAGPDNLNGAVIQYSTDGAAWREAGVVSGAATGATRTISLGGVALRYLRLKRLTGALALGDLRLYSSAAAGVSPLIAEPDTITSTGSAVTFDPRVNDRDLDGHAITIASVEDPPHGQATINAGASITYTPDPGYSGPDSFLYAIADGHDGTASARVSVSVRSATNHSPVAVADSFSVNDRPTAAIEGLNDLRPLNNDYDADGDVLTITALSTPAHGQASVIGGALVRYQPDVGYLGTDALTYTVSDGRGGSASGTIALTAANGAPVAVNDTATVQQGKPAVLILTANDSDPNGDTITITALTVPTRGTAVLNPDQSVTYTPNPGVSGADSFSYTISDGRGATAQASVAISVVTGPPTGRLMVMEPATYASQVNISGNTFTVPEIPEKSSYGVNVYFDRPISTGKTYWEVKLHCGAIVPGVTDNPSVARQSGGAITYNAGVQTYWAGAAWAAGASVSSTLGWSAADDLYGFALDADARVLRIYKNNALGATLNLPFAGPYYPHSGSFTVSGSYQIANQLCTTADAKGEFKIGPTQTIYAPPTGYEHFPDDSRTALTARDDVVYALAGNAKTFDPRWNDLRVNTSPLTIVAVSQPNYGTAALVGGTSITYTPQAGRMGQDSFSYTITDGQGGFSTAVVNTWVGVGPRVFSIDPPVAGNATWNLATQGPLNLGAAGVWTIIPQGAFYAPIKAWGGAGGTPNYNAPGGAGGFAEGQFRFDAGKTYRLYVGGGGSAAPSGANGGLNGGGHSVGDGTSPGGGGGGGYSGLRTGAGALILIAGGGGGGGGTINSYGAGGGGGGAAENGVAYNGLAGGQVGDGGYMQGAPGGPPTSGTVIGGGGGGGGGYLGGGGGASTNIAWFGGGGAGGTGFIDAGLLISANMASGVGATPANSGDPERGQSAAPAASEAAASASGRLILGGPTPPPAAGGDPPYTSPGNFAPLAVADLINAAGGTAKTFDPRSNDSDPNGDALSITGASGAAHGTVVVNAGTSITYTSTGGYLGTDSFSYTVADGGGLTATATVSVNVGAPYTFTISPAVLGKNTWDLSADGPLNLGQAGVWTLTPQSDFFIPVKAWGAAGGSASADSGSAGGAGGYATAIVQFSAGTSYKLYVGGSGRKGGVDGGVNGGGPSTIAGSSIGAGGGGYSGVRAAVGGAGILIAGGGGGSGRIRRGGGGGEGGEAHGTTPGGVVGGGLPYQGGMAGGPTGAVRAGGGGGGYVGGGGGKTVPEGGWGSGGAGGTGYLDPALTSAGQLIAAVGPTPANATDPDRADAGDPSVGSWASPTAGRLVLLRGSNP